MKKLIFVIVTILLSSCKDSKPKSENLVKSQEKIIENQGKNVLVGDWEIDKMLWNTPENEYKMTKPIEEMSFGNIIKFEKNGKFSCDYFAECGTDCLPYSEGIYRFLNDDEVLLQVMKIQQNEFCEGGEFEKNGKWNLGKYKIQKTENGFVLKKI